MFEQLSFFDDSAPKSKSKIQGNIVNGRKITDPLYGYTEEQIKNAYVIGGTSAVPEKLIDAITKACI